jgi:hypothetical protein
MRRMEEGEVHFLRERSQAKEWNINVMNMLENNCK